MQNSNIFHFCNAWQTAIYSRKTNKVCAMVLQHNDDKFSHSYIVDNYRYSNYEHQADRYISIL